jgi:soluble lytic murein transglycosylase-like protein
MSRFTLQHTAGAVWQVIKSGLMLVGLIALVAWEVQTFSHASSAEAKVSPELGTGLDAVRPARVAADTLAVSDEADPALLGSTAEHKRMAVSLAKRYRVSSDATQLIVSAAYLTGRETGVDPLLILAVMAVESRFNPFAESVMGAQGLMQVIPKYHMDKFDDMGGKEAVLNPVANIRVGALILKDYIQRFGGVEAGLKAYSGAANWVGDNGYATKVLAERDRLKAAAGAAKAAVKVETKAVPAKLLVPVEEV